MSINWESYEKRAKKMSAKIPKAPKKSASKQKEQKAKEYKHMTFYEAATMAKEARVKELWLTHYSPSLVRPQDYTKQVQEIFPNTIVPKDRRTTTLLFEEE